MKLTVAICTWNCSVVLDRALDQLSRVIVPEGSFWEVLVVNNNSTDNTDEVIEKYSALIPIRRLFEPVQGLSSARNLAVKEAAGDYIIWMDDDIFAERDWLVEYCKAFKVHPDAVFFGGPIAPFFEGEPSDWLKRVFPYINNYHGIKDYGDKPVPLVNAAVFPYGGNFSVRIKEQRKYLFHPELGRKGTLLGGGEETFVFESMFMDGCKGFSVPGALVKHFIPKNKQGIDYLRRVIYHRHRLQVSIDLAGKKVALLFGKPRYLWKALIGTLGRYMFYRLFSKPEVWIRHFDKFYSTCGFLGGYKKSSRLSL